jgi:ribosome recycling factor
MERNKDLSQDESRRSQDQLQALTDKFIRQMDSMREEKEAEVMEV